MATGPVETMGDNYELCDYAIRSIIRLVQFLGADLAAMFKTDFTINYRNYSIDSLWRLFVLHFPVYKLVL